MKKQPLVLKASRSVERVSINNQNQDGNDGLVGGTLAESASTKSLTKTAVKTRDSQRQVTKQQPAAKKAKENMLN